MRKFFCAGLFLRVIFFCTPGLAFQVDQQEWKNFLLLNFNDVKIQRQIEKVFAKKKALFNVRFSEINLNQPSQMGYFQALLFPRHVKKGQDFLKKYKDELFAAANKYGVDPKYIVSIIYCESNFDLKTMKHVVFNVYASMVLMLKEKFLNKTLKHITQRTSKNKRNHIRFQRNHYRKRLQKKAVWALEQLEALCLLADKLKKDVWTFKGSFAGALGYPQFIPSSYLRYGVDGNEDDCVDLYDMSDSIYSVANYLRIFGFQHQDPVAIRKAVHAYNHDWDYVNVIGKYAQKLDIELAKKKRKKR